MTTTLERLATEPGYDPGILLPNVWSETFRCIDVQCPCGNTTRVRDGSLTTHEPKMEWTTDGQRRAVIRDAYGIGSTCRYSGRTVTLAAALARDNLLTPAEEHVRVGTLDRLRAGVTDTAPAGYTLPKPVAALFSVAEANGWSTAQAWVPERDYETREPLEGEFTVRVLVGRPDGWRYDLSYLVAPGVARRTRFGLCTTPDRRGPYDTPSLKAITAVIRANPVTEG
jgi:hypothetical protein